VIAVALVLSWGVVTYVWAAFRFSEYCEDAGSGCTDGAPIRSILMIAAAVVGIVTLGELAWRASRDAPAEGRWPRLRPALLRLALAFAVWLAFAASLLIR
jgi:hypothetical protein